MRKYLAMLGAAALVVTGLCGLGAQSASADGTLPSPWTDTDVGSPAIAGSASYSNGVFTVNGNGVDIWGSSDQFNYVYQPMTADETIVARVTSQTAADPWSKAGVMVKQSTTAGSTYALLAVTPGNGISFQYGFNQYTSGTSYTFPVWLKMTYYGASGTVIAYSSPDDINWTEVGSTTISMAYPATIGLFSTSHNASAISTATFDNVSVAAAPPLPTGEQPPAGVVSSTPAYNTPHLKTTETPDQQIRQLVQCGNTMYAVGTFDTIIRQSTTYTRYNIFSFSATAPYTVTSWAPDVVGTYGTTSDPSNTLNTIAFVNGNCQDAYIGGKFSSINGTSVANIAEIDTTTGNVVSTFGTSASGAVQTMVGVGNHLLVGGRFTGINGDTNDPYMVSLNPVTGRSDGFLSLNVNGNYNYPGVATNTTQVYNQQLSHGGSLDLVEGDFSSVGGLPRQQMFMLNVSGTTATVTGWTSPEFDGSNPNYPYQCATVEPFYIQAAAWSPDDSTIYIGTTGYHPNGYPVGETPRTGLCDAAAAFPATQTSVLHEWVNYTGCDSLYAAAADAKGVYFAGHERFSMNSNDCDALGPGGYNAPGMEGLDPANGNLYTSADGTVGYYSRDRGLGADDELLTSAGLWIASDNDAGSQMCGGVQNLSGICFLPYNG